MKTLLEATKYAGETRWKHKAGSVRYAGDIVQILGVMGVKDIPLEKLDQGWIDLARGNLRKAHKRSTTTNRKLSSLRSVLNLAGVRVHVHLFPVDTTCERRYFTDDELKAVDAWFRGHDNNVVKAIYAVLRDTGSRGFEELGRLTAADINWENHSVTLKSRKGSRGDTMLRTVWLTEVSSRALSWLVNEGFNPLFTNANFVFFRRAFDAMKDDLFQGDDRVVPYSLRHTFAMRLHKQGVNLHAIAKVMGHASIQTTLSYLHTTTEDKDDILSALA
jgi:integrase